MGDPGRHRRKYRGPPHPWIRQRIEEENILRKEYGPKNKREIYKIESLLSKFKGEAKRLVAVHTKQAELEKKHLLDKLKNLKLLTAESGLADVLAISLKDLMERRVQTLLVRRGMARTVKQARQFITHKHILSKGKPITSPSTLLTGDQENSLGFVPTSALANPSHPEREIKKEEAKEEKPKKKKKESKEKKEERRPKKDKKQEQKPEEGKKE